MARAITKRFSTSTTQVTIARINNGEVVVETYEIEGKASDAKIRNVLRKLLKTDNYMIQEVNQLASGGEQTYTMSADDFELFSEYCEDGKSYGWDTVTATFKRTEVTYLDSEGKHIWLYFGVTSDRKLRNELCKEIGNNNVLVISSEVTEVRKWMPKSEFVENAKLIEQ